MHNYIFNIDVILSVDTDDDFLDYPSSDVTDIDFVKVDSHSKFNRITVKVNNIPDYMTIQ